MIGNKEINMADKKNEKNNEEKKNNTGKVIIITAAVCVVLVCMIFGSVYMGFVYHSSRIADKAVEIYESGNGTDLKNVIAPGYVKYCEDNFKYMTVDDMQQTHIDDFKSRMQDKVGTIQSIDAKRNAVVTVSNVDELVSEFAEYGVDGVEKYRCVDMTWHVTGDKGTADITAQVFVLKCKDGWYLDYVDFPE